MKTPGQTIKGIINEVIKSQEKFLYKPVKEKNRQIETRRNNKHNCKTLFKYRKNWTKAQTKR